MALGHWALAKAGPLDGEVAYRARLEAYARLAGNSLANSKQLAQ